MHYVQKYLEKLPMPKGSIKSVNGGNGTNIFLYCNYYSFYSQKVLMALYEKNVQFEPLVLDITKGEQYSSWFLDINPRGEIPVLKVNNRIIPDSTRILDYLEDYLDPELPPLINVSTDRKVLNNINKFRDLIDALPAGVITVGSFFHPQLCGRPKLPFILPVREVLKSGDLGSSKNLRKLAEDNPKAKGVLLYKAEIQDRKHEILTNEEEYLKILNIVDQVLTQVENQLKDQSEDNWLCCENFSIADVDLAILLHRLWELGLEGRFWAGGKRPLIENYYNRVQQRDSFKKTVPNLPLHVKMIVTSQPPAYVGAAGAASLGVVIAILYKFTMRKVSKSRTDDDGISSANGSVVNDDQSETQQSDDRNDKDMESDPNASGNEAEGKEKEVKKGKSSKKGRKRKTEKEDTKKDTEEEYEVEKVVDSKKIKGKLHYLIRWKGYSADSDTWEPENTLSCPDLISKYHDEKENSKNKESTTPKTGKKRGAPKKEKAGAKKAKPTKKEWDGENADENAEYEVDRILEVHHKKNGKREFLIHWKGWSNKFDSWEPEDNLNCSDLIKKFMDKVKIFFTFSFFISNIIFACFW
ncbi:hypothetical protein MSG28_005156, partial [Choristoneura fumiferana]